MSLVNFTTREITCKIVYYGPGRSGKTTNLQYIYERVPDTRRGRRHAGSVPEVERLVHFWRREDQIGRQVLLVVLQNQRHGARINALFEEVFLQVAQALEILVELTRLAVADEDHPVGALQHELAGRVVVHLAGDRVQLEPGGKPRDRPEVDGQKIEEEGPVGMRRQGHHAAAAAGRHALGIAF